MSSHVTVDRLQFTLTVTFHYLFPILSMGLALMLAWLKSVSYLGRENHRFPLLRKTDEERANYEAARASAGCPRSWLRRSSSWDC